MRSKERLMEAKKKTTKRVSKPKIDKEKVALLAFYEEAKAIKQMSKDGILWRRIIRQFLKIDFDKVEATLSKSK